MVTIEAGTFFMGSPTHEPGRHRDETRHRVKLTNRYEIAPTEVTQALYEQIIGANPSRFVDPSRPVENVSWFDCVHFCNLLSEAQGLRPAYTITEEVVEWDRSADGYRLPTEAEWEFACRAGTTTAYNFGDDPAELHRFANYCDRSCERAWNDPIHIDHFAWTAPVGSFEPNAWGLYDMHGNVWEWCWDWYEPFDASTVVDPTGAATGTVKAERGGCWECGPGMCRQAYRHYVEPDQKRSYLGMRVVRSVGVNWR
jgi:formylglycine-generating enzyme required for sulfatase activity